MERSLTTQITIEASPEAVFAAWTDPKEVTQWWGEDGVYHVTNCDFDLRVGGKWRSEGVGTDGSTFETHGEYLLIDRPNALSMTWTPDWDAAAANTVIELEFVPIAAGTLLKIKHSGFATDDSRDGHDRGWPKVLGWMRRHLMVNVMS